MIIYAKTFGEIKAIFHMLISIFIWPFALYGMLLGLKESTKINQIDQENNETAEEEV